MMVSRCIEFCPATPTCDLDYFASPCMCTTTGTTTLGQQRADRGEQDRRQATARRE
jgi:hypothetical protein